MVDKAYALCQNYLMNRQKHTHSHGNNLMDTLEHDALDIDMTDKREQRKLRMKTVAAFLALATTAATVFAATATRPEAAPMEPATPIEIDEAAWIDVARYDDYGEGGIQVFIDTVSDMRPDLIVYTPDDTGEMVYNSSETVSNIEEEFGVNVVNEGNKIQKIAGGNDVQHGTEVIMEFDGKEFHYSQIDNQIILISMIEGESQSRDSDSLAETLEVFRSVVLENEKATRRKPLVRDLGIGATILAHETSRRLTEFWEDLKDPEARKELRANIQDFVSRGGIMRVGEEDRYIRPEGEPYDFDKDY